MQSLMLHDLLSQSVASSIKDSITFKRVMMLLALAYSSNLRMYIELLFETAIYALSSGRNCIN